MQTYGESRDSELSRIAGILGRLRVGEAAELPDDVYRRVIAALDRELALVMEERKAMRTDREDVSS